MSRADDAGKVAFARSPMEKGRPAGGWHHGTKRNETLLVVVACLCLLFASDFSATRSIPAVELPFRVPLAAMFNPCGLHVNGRYGVSLPASGDGHRRMISAYLDTSSHC